MQEIHELHRQQAKQIRDRFYDEMGEFIGEHFPVGTELCFYVSSANSKPTRYIVDELDWIRSHAPHVKVRNPKSGIKRSLNLLATPFAEIPQPGQIFVPAGGIAKPEPCPLFGDTGTTKIYHLVK